MLNKKFILLSIASLIFCSVSAFATNLTERNVYGILSENVTGALQNCSESEDNICFFTWSGGGQTDPASEKITTDTNVSPKEGKYFLKVTCGPKASGSWAGFSYTFVASDNKTGVFKDISHFRYLDFWIKTKTGQISQLQIGVNDGNDKTVSLSSYVSDTEGAWQHCIIDLNTFGATLSNVKIPFLVICNDLTQSTEFYLDNIVLRTDSSSATFNINLKSVEDMEDPDSSPTQIKWKESSVFRNSWQASSQYVELDMDMYSYAWKVRMWVNNGNKSRNGLYATLNGKDYVIPMCWRVYNGTLVNIVGQNEDTYLIAQSSKEEHNLYDRGKNPTSDPNWYPWFYFKEYNDIDFNNSSDIEYITVWDSSKGYHAANPYYESGSYMNGFYEFNTINKKPKIYFGGDFDQAAGGLNYTSNVVIELSYE